ncbi:MAG: hypothetical protein EXR79_17670 [Myxococcales bacterium]|nr:hypothetical protein [Myxococcales bacterium]
MSDPITVVERVLQLLDEGVFVSTYKHAVLLGLVDLCVELADRDGAPPDAVTTRQLAEKVVALYWNQARPWTGTHGGVLRQNSSVANEVGAKSIVGLVHAFRASLNAAGMTTPLVRAHHLQSAGWSRLVEEVEWLLIVMLLPKLQRAGGEDVPWLYRVTWNDADQQPTRADVRAYQRHLIGARFDNQIRLLPGVGVALSRLHGVLRPVIQLQWAAKVARLNQLEEALLPEFLFGCERVSLEPVRQGLVELQRGVCFYCAGSLRRGEVHVDHFLPWSRHPDDGLANLVAADATCNGQKRDYLASEVHLHRWRHRLTERRSALAEVAVDACWELADERTLGAARALYLPLPDDTRLWAGRGRWSAVDRTRVRAALQ